MDSGKRAVCSNSEVLQIQLQRNATKGDHFKVSQCRVRVHLPGAPCIQGDLRWFLLLGFTVQAPMPEMKSGKEGEKSWVICAKYDNFFIYNSFSYFHFQQREAVQVL